MKRKQVTAIFLIFSFFVVFFGARPSSAEEPLEALKGPVEKVTALLRDPKYNKPDMYDEQREKMWEIARQIFDFEAMARGTLKRYRWEQFTETQRRNFVEAFTQFIGNSYFNRIRGEYHDEKVVFLGQNMQGENKATVESMIVRNNVETPVNYSMWKRGGKWRIFNVYVEGTSLLGNYRNEFERILMDHSPDYLIETLEEKAEKLKNNPEAIDS